MLDVLGMEVTVDSALDFGLLCRSLCSGGTSSRTKRCLVLKSRNLLLRRRISFHSQAVEIFTRIGQTWTRLVVSEDLQYVPNRNMSLMVTGFPTINSNASSTFRQAKNHQVSVSAIRLQTLSDWLILTYI